MEPKFKEGDKVVFMHDKKKMHGTVVVRDFRSMYWEKEQFTYDVECEIGLIKHIPEKDLSPER